MNFTDVVLKFGFFKYLISIKSLILSRLKYKSILKQLFGIFFFFKKKPTKQNKLLLFDVIGKLKFYNLPSEILIAISKDGGSETISLNLVQYNAVLIFH